MPKSEKEMLESLEKKASRAGIRFHTPRGGPSRTEDDIRMGVCYEARDRAKEEDRPVLEVLKEMLSEADEEGNEDKAYEIERLVRELSPDEEVISWMEQM